MTASKVPAMHTHINIVCKRKLPQGIPALLKGDTIWLCNTLTQAERRSTLTHELIHLDRGVVAPPLRQREE